MTEQHLRRGSTVLDRSRNKPLRVVGRDHRTAEEHPDIKHLDAMALQWGVEPDETVYLCVFLPTGEDAVTAPKKPYAYPESRLTRYPVEAALEDDARRVHTQIVLDVLASLLAADWIPSFHDGDPPEAPLDKIVEEAIVSADIDAEVPTEVLLEEALEIAAAETLTAQEAA